MPVLSLARIPFIETVRKFVGTSLLFGDARESGGRPV